MFELSSPSRKPSKTLSPEDQWRADWKALGPAGRYAVNAYRNHGTALEQVSQAARAFIQKHGAK